MVFLKTTVNPRQAVPPAIQSKSFFIDAHILKFFPKRLKTLNCLQNEVNGLWNENFLHLCQRNLDVLNVYLNWYAFWCENGSQQLHVKTVNYWRFILVSPLAILQGLLERLDMFFVSANWPISALGEFIDATCVWLFEASFERTNLRAWLKYWIF